MNDDVNNPSHYNQNGIEVIDVIETYAKHDFRLANVLKYVCRAGYKGHPLQDLQKAQWYLNRVVNEMEELDRDIQLLEERLSAEQVEDDAVNDSWLRGYNEGYADGEPEWDRALSAHEEPIGSNDRGGYTTREVDVFFEGYDCRKQEEAEELYQLKPGDKGYTEEPETGSYECRTEDGRCSYTGKECKGEDCCPLSALDDRLEFHASLATRIAGDNEAASRIKDTYYQFDRFEIQGYCAWCDSEIALGQPFIKDPAYDPSVKFCKRTCVSNLKKWQGR